MSWKYDALNIKSFLKGLDEDLKKSSICEKCGKPQSGVISTVPGAYKENSPSHKASVGKQINELCNCKL